MGRRKKIQSMSNPADNKKRLPGFGAYFISFLTHVTSRELRLKTPALPPFNPHPVIDLSAFLKKKPAKWQALSN